MKILKILFNYIQKDFLMYVFKEKRNVNIFLGFKERKNVNIF